MLRLLLDAHMSARVVAEALRSDGHDVLAIAEHPSLAGMEDPDVLERAVREGRIVVTHDVKDYPPLLRTWAEAGRSHAGCVLVHSVRHDEFGRVIRGLRRLFTERVNPEQWTDLAVVLSPAVT